MPCIAIPQALSVKLRSAVADRTIRKGEADKKAVLIREMLRHQFRDDLYNDWINIHSRKLIRILGRSTYVKQLNRLIDWGVILRTNSFYAGNAPDRFSDKEPFPKAIVLLDGYRNHSNCEFWPISSKHSANAVRDSFTLKPETETARQLAEYLPEFSLRITGDELRLKEFRTAWTLENIDAIQSKRFFMTEDSFSGRIHTNYTQLKSEARNKLFVDNRPVVSLDVSSMQPLLLGWMARESISPARTATNNPTRTNSARTTRTQPAASPPSEPALQPQFSQAQASQLMPLQPPQDPQWQGRAEVADPRPQP